VARICESGNLLSACTRDGSFLDSSSLIVASYNQLCCMELAAVSKSFNKTDGRSILKLCKNDDERV
jgi:hypothetical protein